MLNLAITTLSDYVSSVESNFFYIKSVSVIETVDTVELIDHIVLEPYIKILQSNALVVTLEDSDVAKYKYKPRLLSQEVYGTENLYYLLLLLNNMTVETFIPKQIYVLGAKDRTLVESIINKERLQGTIK